MRFRRSNKQADNSISLHITPMIDIVFQLLVFFVMTLNIVAAEGDFNIKQPSSGGSPPRDVAQLPDIKIRLFSKSDGHLAGITLNGRSHEDWRSVRAEITNLVNVDPSVREEASVALRCDPRLNYEHVIDAITAVSGYKDRRSGKVIRLIDKIKFTPDQRFSS